MPWYDGILRALGSGRPLPRPVRDLGPGEARNWKGTNSGHLQMHWKATGADANTTIGLSAAKLRARSRDLLRNNAHAASAVRKLTTRIVGCGIVPRTATDDEALNTQVDALWATWAKQASVADDLTIYGLQALAVRSMIESGEVLMRRRSRRPGDVSAGKKLDVLLQLQVLEADHLDSYKTENLPNGGRIIQGVEFDPIGRRSAYWLLTEHPGDSLGYAGTDRTSVAIGADGVSHLYEPLRPGQVRGVPWLAPVVVTLRDMDEAQDTELVRMRMASALVAFVESPESEAPTILGAPEEGSDDTTGGTGVMADTNGNPLERVDAGMVAVLRGGKKVSLSTPQAIGGFPEYIASQLQRIAAGLNIPYELLAADLSRVNYSSYRAGNLEFRSMVEAIQDNLVVPLLCEPMRRWFIEAAIAMGLIPDREYPTEWSPPRYEDIDRVKEATADQLEMRSGTVSRQSIIAKKGYDPRRVLAEIVADNEAADADGLVFDSDPRKTSSSGGQQPSTYMDTGSNGEAQSARTIMLAALRYAEEGDEESALDLTRAAVALALPAPPPARRTNHAT